MSSVTDEGYAENEEAWMEHLHRAPAVKSRSLQASEYLIRVKAKDHWRYQKRDANTGRWMDATPGDLLDPSVPTTGLVQLKRTNEKPQDSGGFGRVVDLPRFDVQANGRTLGEVYAGLSSPRHISEGGGQEKIWYSKRPGERADSHSTKEGARSYLLRQIGHENKRPNSDAATGAFEPIADQLQAAEKEAGVNEDPLDRAARLADMLRASILKQGGSQALADESARELNRSLIAEAAPKKPAKFLQAVQETIDTPLLQSSSNESHRVDYRVDGMGDVISSYESGSLDEIRARFAELSFQIVGSSPTNVGTTPSGARAKYSINRNPTSTSYDVIDSQTGEKVFSSQSSFDAKKELDKLNSPSKSPRMAELQQEYNDVIQRNRMGELSDDNATSLVKDIVREMDQVSAQEAAAESAKIYGSKPKVIKDWYKDFPGRNYDGSDHDGVEMRISKQPDGSITQIRQVNEDDETYAPVAGAYGVSYNRVDERGVMPGVMVDDRTRKVSDPNAKPRWETYGRLSLEQALAVEAMSPEIAEAVAKHEAESQSFGNVARLTIKPNPDGTLTIKGQGWEEIMGKPAPTKSLDLQFYDAAFAEVELSLQHAGMNTKDSSDATLRRLFKAEEMASKIPDRGKLSDDEFAMPETRSYPIPDEAHGKLAIGRCKGKPEEDQVRAAVVKKFPQLKEYAKKVLD